METLTGYKAAQRINKRLKDEGLKEIPPQMVYTYKNKGYIESVNVDGKNVIPVEACDEWTEKYVAKKMAQVIQKEEEVEAQLTGE